MLHKEKNLKSKSERCYSPTLWTKMRLQAESRMLSTPDFTLHPWRTEWMGVLLWCVITIQLIIIFLHIIPAADFKVQVEEKASMCWVHLYFTIPIRWDHLKTV